MGSPLEFTPRRFAGWQNRFDDPRRQYRTLYCSRYQITSFLEVLQDLRPNAKALQEFASVFGGRAPNSGQVPSGWLEKRVLAQARVVVAKGTLVNVDDVAVRQRLEKKQPALLVSLGLDHLDISAVRNRKLRVLTQAMSRSLYEAGAAGALFRSNLDARPCAGLFEKRARLQSVGGPRSLVHRPPVQLGKACELLGLKL